MRNILAVSAAVLLLAACGDNFAPPAGPDGGAELADAHADKGGADGAIGNVQPGDCAVVCPNAFVHPSPAAAGVLVCGDTGTPCAMAPSCDAACDYASGHDQEFCENAYNVCSCDTPAAIFTCVGP